MTALSTNRFNPRPPLLAGEPAIPQFAISSYEVSIHARHYWRASHGKIKAWALLNVFQSTPAITGGRARPDRHRRYGDHRVSIHARHYWRASLGGAGMSIARDLFQSTPAITGGRAVDRREHRQGAGSFNPRPPLLAGEPCPASTMVCRASGFNPRPPLLAGEPWI